MVSKGINLSLNNCIVRSQSKFLSFLSHNFHLNHLIKNLVMDPFLYSISHLSFKAKSLLLIACNHSLDSPFIGTLIKVHPIYPCDWVSLLKFTTNIAIAACTG